MIRPVAVGALLFSLSFAPPSSGWAEQPEIYQFTDKEGTVHFTNVPTDPRYRPFRLEEDRTAPLAPTRVEDLIQQAARRFRLDPALLTAVVKTESDFDPLALSSAGAQGLMQLMPATASDLDVLNPYDPYENIQAGARHLRSLVDLFKGDLILALAAYHAGAERVISAVVAGLPFPPIATTRNYVARVLREYEAYRNDISSSSLVLGPD